MIRPEKEIPKTDTATCTVPTSNLTLRQIRARWANGMDPTANPNEMFFDDGNSNGVDPKTFDFHDIQTRKMAAQAQVDFLTNKVKTEQAARAARIQKEVEQRDKYLQDQIKAFMTTYKPSEDGKH